MAAELQFLAGISFCSIVDTSVDVITLFSDSVVAIYAVLFVETEVIVGFLGVGVGSDSFLLLFP